MPRQLRMEYAGAIYHVMSRANGEDKPARLALAARLRRETTLTISQIAKRLRMGSGKSRNNKRWLRRQIKPKES